MSSQSNTSKDEDRMDSGLNGLDLILQHASQQVSSQQEKSHEGMSEREVKKMVQEQIQQQIQEQLKQMQQTQVPQKQSLQKKKSPLTRKPGLYLSEDVDERLGQERLKQKRSKSWIVDATLREKWGMPPLEET